MIFASPRRHHVGTIGAARVALRLGSGVAGCLEVKQHTWFPDLVLAAVVMEMSRMRHGCLV
jgi:hypothetical protein